MPLYEYECTKCGHQFEVIQKFSDPLKSRCPKCGGRLEKLLSAPAIQFKGSGWYVTDYGKGNAAGSNEKPSTKPDKTEPSESKSTEKHTKTSKDDVKK